MTKEYRHNIVLFASDKGGIGKSTCTMHTIDALKQNGMPFRVVDADNANRTIHKAYPEAEIWDLVRPAEESDTLVAHEFDKILLLPEKAGKAKITLVDLPSSQSAAFKRWVRYQTTEDLNELGIRLIIALTTSQLAEHIAGAMAWAQAAEEKAEYIVFAMQKGAEAKLEKASEIATQLVALAEDRVIYVPSLPSQFANEWRANNVLLSTMLESKVPIGILTSVIVKQRMKTQYRMMNDAIGQHIKWLMGEPDKK